MNELTPVHSPVVSLSSSPFCDGRVGAGRVELVGRFGVEPVVRTAQAEALGRDHADVGRREALAQGARVEDVDGVVGQPGHPLVARGVGLAREFAHLDDLVLFGVDRDLDLVDDRVELVEDLGVQDLAEVGELEPLVLRRLADRIQMQVALAHVQRALGEVDEVVELALDDRLEVGLHLATGDVDHDAERNSAAFFDVVDLRVRRPSILPSVISEASSVRTHSNAGVRCPPASAYVSSLRTRSPSNAGPYATGTGTSATLIVIIYGKPVLLHGEDIVGEGQMIPGKAEQQAGAGAVFL